MSIASESSAEVTFRVQRRLGEGGTAVAYLATRVAPEGTSPVVLKVIQPSIIAQGGDTARMVVQKEAVALGRLNERVPPSPFVVRLLDVGSVDYDVLGPRLSLPWLALEYVHGGAEGVTLEDRVLRCVDETGFGFDPERALRALRHVTEGLREIHEVGVIHRDITPNNVLCCGSGQNEIFKISDFGIARPIGMHATFGTSTVGTPGYIAPEQVNDNGGPVGFHSDIFSLGALLFFLLTGEQYLESENFWEVLVLAQNPERRSIREAASLAPEIREDEETCQAIDLALAAATAYEPRLRPQSARAFAASVSPWLSSCPKTTRNPLARLESNPPPSLAHWQFSLRHPVGHDWVLTRVGWDGDGHCLGASTRGVMYFDGTKWTEVPPASLAGLTEVRFTTRVGAGRWLLGGHNAVAEYSRTGVTRILHGKTPSLELHDASGDLADLAAFIGSEPSQPPLLCAASAGRWLKALPVPQAAALLDLARLTDDEWLVVGRSHDGAAMTWLYEPLEWNLRPLSGMECRAFIACATRAERELGIAVGADGAVLRLERGRPSVLRVPGSPQLSAVGVDVLGRAWVGAAGELWFSPDGGSTFQLAWRDATWRAPFVSIFADVGLVFAATADGAVLEGRATSSALK